MFFGPVVNAARAIAVQVSGATTSFTQGFLLAIHPQTIKLYAAEKMDELYSFIFQSAKYSFSLMWLLFLPMTLEIQNILKIWLVEVPEHAALFCQLMLIQSLIACVQRPFVITIQAVGKMKALNIAIGIVLFSVLLVSYFSLKVGSLPYVPFLVCIFGTATEFFVELYLLKKWIKLPIITLIKTVFVPQILIVICSLPFAMLVSHYFSFITTILFSILSVCISVYFIAFNKEMRAKVLSKLYKKIKFY
jgi:O-antigen/teichoic acid export membrane protein